MSNREIPGLSLDDLRAAAEQFEPNEEERQVRRDEEKYKDWIEGEEQDRTPGDRTPGGETPADTEDPMKQKPVAPGDLKPVRPEVTEGPKTEKHEDTGKEKETEKKPQDARSFISGAPAALDSLPFFGVLYRAVVYKRYGLLFWVILNAAAVGGIMTIFYSSRPVVGVVMGVVIYIVTQMIVVGVVGDKLLQGQSGCAEIKDRAILDRLRPIFDRVYADARAVSPHISDKVRFCMSEDEFPNAYASGRTTVCITRGLLDMEDDQIEGILAHEFGHMAHRDTDESQVIWLGNIFISVFLSILGVIAMLFCAICSTKDGLEFMGKVGKALQAFIAITLINVWVMLGTMVCGMTNRQEEYDADRYAAELGRGPMLVSALAEIDSGSGAAKGVWKALNSSHPDTQDRVMRIMNYEQNADRMIA